MCIVFINFYKITNTIFFHRYSYSELIFDTICDHGNAYKRCAIKYESSEYY